MHDVCEKCMELHEMRNIDQFDRKILAALQEDGRLTNAELSDRAGLSASQCSRRRMQLEQDGIIQNYAAQLDPSKIGVELISMISITLSRHDDAKALAFRQLLKDLPNVLDAFALTGEMDYMIKVVSPNLDSLSTFVNTVLLPHGAVHNVRTAIALDTIKQTMRLPL